MDWEATCWDKATTPSSSHAREIIEFPVIVLNAAGDELGTFHQFVLPEESRGKLSIFCTNLKGITEERVKGAKTLEHVIADFLSWLNELLVVGSMDQKYSRDLQSQPEVANDQDEAVPMRAKDAPARLLTFVTCGSWDGEHLAEEIERKEIQVPEPIFHTSPKLC